MEANLDVIYIYITTGRMLVLYRVGLQKLQNETEMDFKLHTCPVLSDLG